MKNIKIIPFIIVALFCAGAIIAKINGKTTETVEEPVKQNIVEIAEAEIIPETDDSAQLYKEIDQMFIIGFRGFDFNQTPEIKKILAETNLGGVILFDYDTTSNSFIRNIKTQSQLENLIKNLNSNAKIKMFISIDEEGGKVSRLKNLTGFIKAPPAIELGVKSNDSVYQIASDLGSVLYKIGFNMDFAPVADVNVNPTSPAIGFYGRSFSDSSEIVSEKATIFAKGLEDQNMISVFKHYPGHGSAKVDSHKGLTDITNTFQDYELEPFKYACDSGINVIMIGHLINKNVDKIFPASMSKKHIDNLKSLGCKNQVFVTDDIDMKALSSLYSRHDILVKVINSGIDIIISSNNIVKYDPNKFMTDRKIVFDAVKNGEISRERIRDAYNKVTLLKQKYKIIY